MQALVLNNGLSFCQDLPKPAIAAGEALIRLKLAGICATDLELVNGYAGFSGIIGHEFVGVVEAVGWDGHGDWLQKRVVGSINIGCQACEVCRKVGPEHCLNRRVLGIRGHDGVFADYFTLPVANLFAVPEGIADAAAVFTEPLAAAIRVLEQIQSLKLVKIAVIGPGRLGLLIAKVLASAEYDVEVLGRTETSLGLPGRWLLKTGLVWDAEDNGYDCVVDASGQASGFSQALRLTRPRGTLILKSTFSAVEPVDLTKLVVAELNVLGSRCGPFADALALLERRVIQVEDLIDGCHALGDGLAAFEHAAKPGVRKILLKS